MNMLNLYFAMVKADFLERTRRTSFLITVGVILYLGFAVNTGQVFIKLDTYRGIYNSAWVGSLMSLVITFFLGLAGFYLVKNAIERDERTGVGQVIATTSLSRPQYLLGKWLSNYAVLIALVGILALAAILMQVVYREDAQIHVLALIAPFLFIALPMMALVAAIAVFFEAVSWLKGGFGNLVYFGVFLMLFSGGIFLTDFPWLDVSGVSLVGASMKAAAREAFPTYGDSFILSMADEAPVQTFTWLGVNWSVGIIIQRLMWVAASFCLVLAGSLFFNRFDPNRRSIRKGKPVIEETFSVPETVDGYPTAVAAHSLTSLPERLTFHNNFLRLVWLECVLLVKGLKWYWWAGLAILWVGGAFIQEPGMRPIWFALTSIWPILVWSKMGVRETRYHTEELIYQAPYPLARMVLSSWLAGVFLTAVAFSGILIGRLVTGEAVALLPWSLSVLFIPSLAMALGTWSRSSKLFEVVYTILWYLGPLNKENGLVVLDYLGIHAQAPVNTRPLLFAAVIVLLLLVALAGQKRQMSR